MSSFSKVAYENIAHLGPKHPVVKCLIFFPHNTSKSRDHDLAYEYGMTILHSLQSSIKWAQLRMPEVGPA